MQRPPPRTAPRARSLAAAAVLSTTASPAPTVAAKVKGFSPSHGPAAPRSHPAAATCRTVAPPAAPVVALAIPRALSVVVRLDPTEAAPGDRACTSIASHRVCRAAGALYGPGGHALPIRRTGIHSGRGAVCVRACMRVYGCTGREGGAIPISTFGLCWLCFVEIMDFLNLFQVTGFGKKF